MQFFPYAFLFMEQAWFSSGRGKHLEKLSCPYLWCYNSDTKDTWRIPEMRASGGLHNTQLCVLCIACRARYTLEFPYSVCLYSRGKSAALCFRYSSIKSLSDRMGWLGLVVFIYGALVPALNEVSKFRYVSMNVLVVARVRYSL